MKAFATEMRVVKKLTLFDATENPHLAARTGVRSPDGEMPMAESLRELLAAFRARPVEAAVATPDHRRD